MKLIGIKEVNYISKKTQNPVHGYEFVLSYPSSKMLVGEGTVKKFVSESVVERSGGLPTHAFVDIELQYNVFGNIESYSV